MLMYQFCYDQVKLKHGEKSKLYYMDAQFNRVHKNG